MNPEGLFDSRRNLSNESTERDVEAMKAGWYRDKNDHEMARYWNGEEWTGQTRLLKGSGSVSAQDDADTPEVFAPPSSFSIEPAPGDRPKPPVISPDGLFYWNGNEWQPLPSAVSQASGPSGFTQRQSRADDLPLDGFGVVSLTLGAIAILIMLFLHPSLGIWLSITALVLSAVSDRRIRKGKSRGRWLAITGSVLAIVGIGILVIASALATSRMMG